MKQSFLLPDQGWSQNYCEEIDVILTIGPGTNCCMQTWMRRNLAALW